MWILRKVINVRCLFRVNILLSFIVLLIVFVNPCHVFAECRGILGDSIYTIDLGILVENGTTSSESNTLTICGDSEDIEYYKFKAPSDGTAIIYTTSNNSDFDNQGWLFRFENESIFYYLIDDNDTGEGKNFQITYNLTEGLTYYLITKLNDISTAGEFRLHIRFTNSPEDKSWYKDYDNDEYSDKDTPPKIQPDPPAEDYFYEKSHFDLTRISTDCNDNDPAIHPNVPDNTCDGIDNDCDGSIDEDAPKALYYEDKDGDGYGSSASDAETRWLCEAQAGWSLTNGDCDDNISTGALIHPGADDNTCDEIDNDCDGSIDEDALRSLYYLDNDNDGYGSNDSNTQTLMLCEWEAGWSLTNDDCEDGDASIHPGAFDICDNGINEDCLGGDRVCSDNINCFDISDSPLTTAIKSGPPMIMFVLDDSGSMKYELILKGSVDGCLGNTRYAISTTNYYWKTRCYQYNSLYYNPSVSYKSWPGYSDSTNPSQCPKRAGTGNSVINLLGNYKYTHGVRIKYAHYFIKSGTIVYLVNYTSATNVNYYKVNYSNGTSNRAYNNSEITSLTSVESAAVPDNVSVSTQNLNNFMNWYSFHRSRELASKSAIANVLTGMSGVNVGIDLINGTFSPLGVIDIDEGDNKQTLLDNLFAVNSSGGTRLRSTFQDVGEYFSGTGTNSPFENVANGGECQQAYCIMMTDGYYYNTDDYLEDVGNTDQDSTSAISVWDGWPYGDTYSDTLADIAMKYYETDISTLGNGVIPSTLDKATHQHMVTYSVAFGVTGTLPVSQYDFSDCPEGGCPTGDAGADCRTKCNVAWTNPRSGNKQKIDDLFHASVNGRGDFLVASDSKGLETAFQNLVDDVQRRTLSAAPVSISSQKLESDSYLYQVFYNSSDWSGNVKAYLLSEDGSLASEPAWEADTQFKAKVDASANWWNSSNGRQILTLNSSSKTCVPFKYDSLSDAQKTILSQDQLNYLRGDSSKEKSKGGTYRNRNGKLLGDIVNSSPVFVSHSKYDSSSGLIYVGANDGMLHAFDKTTGDEKFAYLPNLVYEKLLDLTDENYIHQFYVDKPVYTRWIDGVHYLVGGLGKGGRGIYSMDITSQNTFSETNLPSSVWEFPAPDASQDSDAVKFMGYSYSQPTIVKLKGHGPVIIFGNGYDSEKGIAALYIMSVNGGDPIKIIDTEFGDSNPANELCNGLGSPVAVDSDYDGFTDIVYAGDLLGNMWKFDLSSSSPGEWGPAYYEGNTPKPLFTAKNSNGESQTIYGKPAVIAHCDSSKKGYIILFGTGRFFAEGDSTDTRIQTIYGIWDWGEAWEDAGENKNLGELSGDPRVFNSLNGKVSNLNTSAKFTLQRQTVADAGEWVNVSKNPISWFSVNKWKEDLESGETYTGGMHLGWYIDLGQPGERVISRAQVRDGILYISSMTPENSPCTAGGTSIVYLLNACSGGAADHAVIDINGDGKVDNEDYGVNPDCGGKKYDDIKDDPALLGDKMYTGTKDDDDENPNINNEILGLFYWRLFY